MIGLIPNIKASTESLLLAETFFVWELSISFFWGGILVVRNFPNVLILFYRIVLSNNSPLLQTRYFFSQRQGLIRQIYSRLKTSDSKIDWVCSLGRTFVCWKMLKTAVVFEVFPIFQLTFLRNYWLSFLLQCFNLKHFHFGLVDSCIWKRMICSLHWNLDSPRKFQCCYHWQISTLRLMFL